MLASDHLVVGTSDKRCAGRQEEEDDDKGTKVDLSFIDHEGAKRCAITEMLVGNAGSLCNGKCTPCSERVQRGVVLMVKLRRSLCPSIELHEQFDRKGIGKMKQNFSHFRKVSTGEKVCSVTGKTWCGEFDET